MELRGANRRRRLPAPINWRAWPTITLGTTRRSGAAESAYGKVKYQGIYPGIDAVFYGNQRQLEYDFVVAPGADPKQISLGLAGVNPSLDAGGNVVLKLADGDLALKKPVVYQNIDGEKKTVDAGYTIAGNKVRFHLGKYDRNQTLVIDPVFTYLTYLGGSGPDQIGGIQVVDQSSNPARLWRLTPPAMSMLPDLPFRTIFLWPMHIKPPEKSQRLDGLCECTEPIRHRVSVLHLSGRIRFHLGELGRMG